MKIYDIHVNETRLLDIQYFRLSRKHIYGANALLFITLIGHQFPFCAVLPMRVK